MAKNYFEFKIGDEENIVTIRESSNCEIEISGKVYIIPSGAVDVMRKMANEIEAQQTRRVATDAEIDRKIDQRIDRMLRSLSACGLLRESLDKAYPLPPGVESSGGPWTFFEEARRVARGGLHNDYGDNLADDIGTPKGVIRETA